MDNNSVKGTCHSCTVIKPRVGSADGLKIVDLISLETLQRLQDSFAEATGVASIITDDDGNPITKPSNYSPLCRMIRETADGLANCKLSNAMLIKENPTGPVISPCLGGGFWEGTACIKVGDRHIANWLIGQVRNESVSDDEMLSYAQQIGVDKDEFENALKEAVKMPAERFSKICNALFVIANQLSELAYKNMALKASESNLRITLDSIGDAVIATDGDGKITQMNPVAEALTGWNFSEAKGLHIEDALKIVDADSKISLNNPGVEAMKNNVRVGMPPNAMLIDKRGIQRMVADTAAPIRDIDGKPVGAVIVFRDISEQRLLEDQLRQSQKMEAVGRLAGGVAHDFNNMLGGILGAAELLARKTSQDPSSKRLVEIILDATARAAGLTRKLLDFSRKGMLESVPLDMHKIIENSIAILERSFDRKVDIVSNLEAEYSIVRGDASQLQSAIMNLGINARDAMPSGGRLTISTRNIDIVHDDSRFFSTDTIWGRHIEISISDTGVGMPPEVLHKLFEPFFTTKDIGKGTGLGLAAVYGSVKEHKGAIHVYSEVGKGTVFKIYLPLAMDHSKWQDTKAKEEIGACKIGRILLVDDEPLIRSTGQMLLESLGNEVVLVEDGLEAVEKVKAENGKFDLIIMDMIMPRMNGREAFSAIEMLYPGIPFIFASGFTRNERMDELMAHKNAIDFISKPYRSSTMKRAIEMAIAKRES